MAPRGLTSELACCQRRRSPDKAEMVFDSDPLEAPRTRETGRPSGTRQSSAKHVSKSMACFSSGLLLQRCTGQPGRCGSRPGPGRGGEEARGRGEQFVDAAMEPVGRDGVLEQPPDPLDRIVLVRAVLGQPRNTKARMVRLG